MGGRYLPNQKNLKGLSIFNSVKRLVCYNNFVDSRLFYLIADQKKRSLATQMIYFIQKLKNKVMEFGFLKTNNEYCNLAHGR